MTTYTVRDYAYTLVQKNSITKEEYDTFLNAIGMNTAVNLSEDEVQIYRFFTTKDEETGVAFLNKVKSHFPTSSDVDAIVLRDSIMELYKTKNWFPDGVDQCLNYIKSKFDVAEDRRNDKGEEYGLNNLFRNVIYSYIARYILKLNVLPRDFNTNFDMIINDTGMYYPFHFGDKDPINKLLFETFIDRPYLVILSEYYGIYELVMVIVKTVIHIDHVVENVVATRIRGAKAFVTHTQKQQLYEDMVDFFKAYMDDNLAVLRRTDMLKGDVEDILTARDIPRFIKLFQHDSEYKTTVEKAITLDRKRTIATKPKLNK